MTAYVEVQERPVFWWGSGAELVISHKFIHKEVTSSYIEVLCTFGFTGPFEMISSNNNINKSYVFGGQRGLRGKKLSL